MRYHPPTRWLKQALELLRLPTVSFHEQNVMLWVWRYAHNRGMPVSVDAVGNLRVDYVPEDADDDARPIVFTAHTDHVGLWAVEMQNGVAADDGRAVLRAHWMGRFPSELMVGQDVLFWTGGKPLGEVEPELVPSGARGMADLKVGGRKVRGTIQRILGFNEEGDVTGVDVAVDEAVEPGSVGMWDLPDPEQADGKLFARAIDDVAGVAALVALLDDLRRDGAARPVSCLFTRAEEGGFFGAIHHCKQRYADATEDEAEILITIEASKQLADAPVGGGPIVRVGDKHAVFHPELTAWAAACAERLEAEHEDFQYRRRLMDGGTCESSVFQAWTGKAGALCVALGNYHNHDAANNGVASEFIDVADFGNLIRLMRAMVDEPTGAEAAGGFGAFRGWCEEWEAKHAHLYSEPAGVAP
ncbi:hypothetical protein PSMK_16050 [Phycisphaera mikurensis NBRC 102666]|uniref:M20/M25/M40 family metallo-hydrolase n=2 Tax=Phycisphaera TaxID=666508 RepID=I0IES6_PHYMF|nr:hypothetical protein PSMK_16050 [Phycisphaera mikurensis NBRC 102666]